MGTTERDDWENGTEREDFDGISETPSRNNNNAGALASASDGRQANQEKLLAPLLNDEGVSACRLSRKGGPPVE